jgi:hypothetical protein
MSVHATREAFSEIVLDEPELDPKACLTGHLNAIISEPPYDQPVTTRMRKGSLVTACSGGRVLGIGDAP